MQRYEVGDKANPAVMCGLLARKHKALTKVKSILHHAVVEWKWPIESDDVNSDDETENQQGGGFETDSDNELSDGD